MRLTSFIKNAVKKSNPITQVKKSASSVKSLVNPIKTTKSFVRSSYDFLPNRAKKNFYPGNAYKSISPSYNLKRLYQFHQPSSIVNNTFRPSLRYAKPSLNPALNGVVSRLFDTNDLKGCAMFGAETWNELKATVAGFAADVLDGKYYVVPTIISCPARGSGDSLTDELFGFNDDYAAMLGAKWYERAWSGIKDFTKDTTHMVLSVGNVIPITKPFVSAIRSVNDAGKNLLQQFGIIKKSSSDDEAPAGVVTGGGLLILAGVGVGAYFLLKDDKKKKRG